MIHLGITIIVILSSLLDVNGGLIINNFRPIHPPVMFAPKLHLPPMMYPHHPHLLPPMSPYGHLHGFGPGELYHHSIFLRSIKEDDKNQTDSVPPESNKKVAKDDNASVSSEENISEEKSETNDTSSEEHFDPKVVVRQNGKLIFESDKCLKGKSVNNNSDQNSINSYHYPMPFYPSYSIYGLPFGQPMFPMDLNIQPGFPPSLQNQLLVSPPMWQHTPSLESLTLDQGHPIPTSHQLINPPMHQHFPIIPQTSPSTVPNILQTNPLLFPPTYDHRPIIPQMPVRPTSLHQELHSPILQQPLFRPQMPLPQNQMLLHSRPFHQPINPSMIPHTPLMLPQMFPHQHQPIPLQPMIAPVPLHHGSIPPRPSHHYPPCPSLYSPPQQTPKNQLLSILSPNKFMDSVDKIFHPYLFTYN